MNDKMTWISFIAVTTNIIIQCFCQGQITTTVPAPTPNPATVPVLSFMEMTPVASAGTFNFRDMIYFYQNSPFTPDNAPAQSATVCFWAYMRRQSDTDTFVSIQTILDPLQAYNTTNFVFVTIGISAGKLAVQSHKCSQTFKFIIHLREWHHFCVTLSTVVSFYANGKKLQADTPCPFSGTSILTSAQDSFLTLGSNPYIRVPIDGKLADVRLYPKALDEATISKIKTFTEISDYVSVIVEPDSFLPNGVQLSLISVRSLIAPKPNASWFFIPESVPFPIAKDTCKKFGGEIIHTKEIQAKVILQYAQEVLRQLFLKFWAAGDQNSCLSVSVNPVDIVIQIISCNDNMNFICSIPKTVQYRLKGLDPVYAYPLMLVPEDNAFDAVKTYRIAFKNGIIYGLNAYTNEAILRCDKHVYLTQFMGRKNQWRPLAAVDYMSLSITACEQNQFTCDDGHCVDLYSVCNSLANCEDYSDEFYCNHTQFRPTYYDRDQSGLNSMLVSANMELKRVLSVNMEDNTLDVEYELEVSWTEPRVQFHNLHPGVKTYLPEQDGSFYWQPNVKLNGVINEHEYSLSFARHYGSMYLTAKTTGKPFMYGSVEVIANNGRDVLIEHSTTKIVKIMCTMNLFIYPFDIQKCSMDMEIEGFVQNDAEWNKEAVNIFVGKNVKIQLYEFLDFKGTVQNKEGNPIHIELKIARLYGSHILITFLPCILLQIIGLSVFAIPIDDLSDRLTVSISCLIVMAALLTQMSLTLPVSAEPKMIDIWMFVHVLVMAVAFVLQLALHHFHILLQYDEVDESGKTKAWTDKVTNQPGRTKKNFAMTVNNWTFVICLLSYAIYVLYFFVYCAILREKAL